MKNIDYRISLIDQMPSPAELERAIIVDDKYKVQIKDYREQVQKILSREDKRLLAVVGPCSIHDKKGAIEYATKLKKLSEKVKDTMFIVMRTYFEKPRTVLGWKGLIVDPDMDETYDIEKGLYLARKILVRISEIGLPVGCEVLDPIVPQYIDQLMSWASIGARTTESQTHRNLSSGLSVPIGFKNSTNGNTLIAINAIKTAQNPSAFIGIDKDGKVSIMRTKGNRYSHLILRGGAKPNYNRKSVSETAHLMEMQGLKPCILIDLSHGNSQRIPLKQIDILNSVIRQVLNGDQSICGFMLESYLYTGTQSIVSRDKLRYGVSVTDPCLGFDETEKLLLKVHKKLLKRM